MLATDVPSALLRHPASACAAVRALEVAVRIVDGDRVSFAYALDADLERLRIPEERAAARRAEELWRHTCFEAFVGVAGSAAYCELNFAPSRAWALYRFSARRQGMAVISEARAPKIDLTRSSARLTLAATVYWRDLIHTVPPLKLRLAVAAVLEDEAGALSYWALRHPPGAPDFHHPEGFMLELDL